MKKKEDNYPKSGANGRPYVSVYMCMLAMDPLQPLTDTTDMHSQLSHMPYSVRKAIENDANALFVSSTGFCALRHGDNLILLKVFFISFAAALHPSEI